MTATLLKHVAVKTIVEIISNSDLISVNSFIGSIGSLVALGLSTVHV